MGRGGGFQHQIHPYQFVSRGEFCSKGLLGALCPGESCQSKDDCASACCTSDLICADPSQVECRDHEMPIWAILTIVSVVILVLGLTLALVIWLKRRHQEDMTEASNDSILKDDVYEQRRRSTISMRRSMASN